MTKSCDICGREMVLQPWVSMDTWNCPSSPDQHKIAELEKRNAELVDQVAKHDAEDEALLVVLPEDWGAVEYIKALEKQRDEARSQLREAQERELALNRVLSVVKEELDKDHECPGCHLPLIAHHGLLERALARTSATAQQTVEKIERDTRKAIWDAVKDMWGASPMQFRAAILGESHD